MAAHSSRFVNVGACITLSVATSVQSKRRVKGICCRARVIVGKEGRALAREERAKRVNCCCVVWLCSGCSNCGGKRCHCAVVGLGGGGLA